MQEQSFTDENAFARVWSRVTAGLSEQLTPQQEQQRAEACLQQAEGVLLLQLLEQTQRLAARYRQLARRCGPVRRTLSALYAARRRCAQQLRLEYYLRTGESLPQPADTPAMPGVLSALRAAWLAEGELERACRDAACRTGSTELAGLYLEQAGTAQTHARTLRRLIEGMLGQEDT
ncbi:MAG: hypothetical protein MR033_06490 [Clostridiales bacterium]|nr:hypothetical protein [Clostridiales bacterium]